MMPHFILDKSCQQESQSGAQRVCLAWVVFAFVLLFLAIMFIIVACALHMFSLIWQKQNVKPNMFQ